MKAMILAAGRGSRMGDLTNDIPKPLTKIGKLTLIEHNILRLKNSGIYEICINVSYLGNKIKEYLKSGNHLGVNIHYLDETKQMLGTGGGILNALNFLGDDPFWLVNADLYSDYEIPNKKKLKPSLEGHLILVPNPPHNSDGDFCLEGDNVYLSHEKNFYTYSGISLLSPKLFKNIRKKIFSLEPLLESKADDRCLSGEFYDGFWLDVGTKERLNFIHQKINNHV